MEDYKVRYEDFTGFHVTEWMEKKNAELFFNKLKNEKVIVTKWAELIFSPVDGDPDGNETVIEEFTRKTITIFGKEMIIK